jgi:hypothetical protein
MHWDLHTLRARRVRWGLTMPLDVPVPVCRAVSEWDKDGDNSVSKDEFRQNVAALGLTNPTAEVEHRATPT